MYKDKIIKTSKASLRERERKRESKIAEFIPLFSGRFLFEIL